MPELSGEESGVRRGRLAAPRARIGVIVPSSNRLAEPQFAHYLPTDVGVNATRLRISGGWKKTFEQGRADIAFACAVLSDAKPDVIVYNCTGASMHEGPAGDARILDFIRGETEIPAVSTASAIVDALHAAGIEKLVLVTPYDRVLNDREIKYLRATGFDVLHDIALAVGDSDNLMAVPPERWIEIAVANDRPESDGYLLSCTNTTQIEAIAEIERRVGKPVITSNQAVMWACLQLIGLGARGHAPLPHPAAMGRLFERRAIAAAAE